MSPIIDSITSTKPQAPRLGKTNNVLMMDTLEPDQFTARKLVHRLLTVSANALGPVNLPIFAYRGSDAGPIIGITSAIHGNEVNGIAVIQRLFARLEKMRDSSGGTVIPGTIIGVPVLNVPGF